MIACDMEENEASLNKTNLRVPKILQINLETLIVNNIQEISLQSQNLTLVPNEIFQLKNLKSLNLSFNQLKSLPMQFECLKNLKCLNIAHNIFTEVPEIIIKKLDKLTELNISWNQLTSFDHAPASLFTIKTLNISNNKLWMLPAWVFYPRCFIEILDLHGNQLSREIEPIEGDRLYNSLKSLNVDNCGLVDTTFLVGFPCLEELNIGNCEKIKQSKGINDLVLRNPQLKKIICSSVFLSLVPSDLASCLNLTYLDLSQNELSFLPGTFGNFKYLETLILSQNKLHCLPDSFAQLPVLKTLLLNCNLLECMPDDFSKIASLAYLDLYDNNLTELYGIEKMNLELLDVELNELPEINIPNYENMKDRLRRKLPDGCRKNYQKESILFCDEVSSSCSEDLSDRGLNFDPEYESDKNDATKSEEVTEESWDNRSVIADDDEFDPFVEICYFKRRIDHFSTHRAPEPSRTYLDVYVEGQFDDAS